MENRQYEWQFYMFMASADWFCCVWHFECQIFRPSLSHILKCAKHYEHHPNIELCPLFTSEQSPFVRAWTLQGVESVPQGCWPMLTPMLHRVVSSWLDVLWEVDHSWYTQTHKPVHSEWHTNTIHVSVSQGLENPSLTCHLPFIYTDWGGFNRWHQ